MRAEGIAKVNEDKGDRRTIRGRLKNRSPDIIRTINFVLHIFFCLPITHPSFFHTMRPRRSSRPYYRSCSSSLSHFFLFSKTHSGSRREPIARSHPRSTFEEIYRQ